MRSSFDFDEEIRLGRLCQRPPKTLEEFLGSGPHFFVSSGRDALVLIINVLELTPKDEVLLPPYLCDVVVDVFRQRNIKVRFYKVKTNLEIDAEDALKRISKKTKAILYINYFGFPQPQHQVDKLMATGLDVIEDNSHSFLSRYEEGLERRGTFSFASLRKLLPIPDGAVLMTNREDMKSLRLAHSVAHLKYVCSRFVGLTSKNLARRWPRHLTEFIPRECLSYAERLLSVYPNPAPMSRLSRFIMRRVNVQHLIARRRENFVFLSEVLRSAKFGELIFDSLSLGVCPYGLPILAEDRDLWLEALAHQRIFGAALWQLPKEIDANQFSESWDLSRRIIVLPVREGLTHDEILEVGEIIAALQVKR